MTNNMNTVRPGDVISSDLMNFILTKLSEIDQRVTDLESGGGTGSQVIITSFEPPTQIAAGQELTINGVNFAFPAMNNEVYIDGVRITEFRAGSTSTRLRFIVPTTLSIPAGGKNVTVQVRNNAGEYSALYRVLPAVQAPGNPPVIESVTPLSGSLISVNAGAIIHGQNFADDPLQNQIQFEITSGGITTTYPLPGETIQINPANSNTEQIEVTVPNIVQIPAGQSRSVTVRVTVGAHVPATLNINIRRPLTG